ncbi:GntR family transcriptional regulator [Pelagibius litoralis]|uniref:GntR family transcriptional regulator n=1 Tax=Pelagibius litoralis TaxID=374515 RepID=A0A967EXV3_9PROT|nr:GntR family transcriptional regulator [Pelagibius litoralis]NIA69400.1 GntR family transcriptional regulator [Pelagibius litoralis]
MNIKTLSPSPEASTQDASATQRAYLAIRRMIVVGELPPGEKLKIDSLRSMLDTGASPIREALSLLTSDQLVERIDQRGFRTAATSLENFEEILALRCSLEDMALRQSIANASEQWEESLVLSHHRMVRESRDNIERFEERHKAFHMALLDNCGSSILLRFCSQLYDLNIRYRYLAGKSLNYQKKRDVSKEHEDILNAAIERNADLASERLLNHYRQTGAFLTGLFSTASEQR